MLALKIIFCAIFGIIGFYAFMQTRFLDELYRKASDHEQKALDKLYIISTFLPLCIIGIIAAE